MSLLTDQLKDENMTLDEKLAAIDAAMALATATVKSGGRVDAPVDPSDATMCIGCQ